MVNAKWTFERKIIRISRLGKISGRLQLLFIACAQERERLFRCSILVCLPLVVEIEYMLTADVF